MTKAEQCKAILAEFAQRSGLVRESACGKRKRADLDEVRKHLERLQAMVDALKMHTGMVDLDDILKGLPAPQIHLPNRSLYTAAPPFSFSFPPHIPLQFGIEFVSNDRYSLCIVGYMKQRPTFSVLCVPKSMLHAVVPVEAFKFYSTKYVMKQLGKDDTAMREARIRRCGPALNIYESDMTARFKMSGEIVRIDDINPKGDRRIRMVSISDPMRGWCVNGVYFHKLERVQSVG
jgi:hypothetical protein